MPKKTGIKILWGRVCSMLLMAAILFCAFPAPAAHAATWQKAAWIRAKVEYEYDEGVTGLDDSVLVFSNDKWTKDDDNWYYYKERVFSGDRIRFIDAVRFPTSWDNDIINKKFKIIVTVEACEAVRGDEGYAKNHPSSYSQTYELWSMGYSSQEALDVSKSGRMTVKINEYQLDEDGDEVPYKNRKVIVPGEKVSKIVEFELNMQSTLEQLLTSPVETGDVPYLAAFALATTAMVIVVFVVIRKNKKD